MNVQVHIYKYKYNNWWYIIMTLEAVHLSIKVQVFNRKQDQAWLNVVWMSYCKWSAENLLIPMAKFRVNTALLIKPHINIYKPILHKSFVFIGGRRGWAKWKCSCYDCHGGGRRDNRCSCHNCLLIPPPSKKYHILHGVNLESVKYNVYIDIQMTLY